MIRLIRSKTVPASLKKRGADRSQSIHKEYLTDPASYHSGKKILKFDSNIYGAQDVKAALIKTQFGKCCFCESKIVHISYGDVEHFRPKGAWRQSKEDQLTRPGYYWLAYTWDNLLLACQLCNQRFKGNTFPLLTIARRIHTPSQNIAQEDPEFINPYHEDPDLYIKYRGDTPYSVNNNQRGTSTITSLGLRRKALRERRLAVLEPLKLIYQLATGQIPCSPADKMRAEEILEDFTSPQAEYSAAVKSSLEDGFAHV